MTIKQYHKIDIAFFCIGLFLLLIKAIFPSIIVFATGWIINKHNAKKITTAKPELDDFAVMIRKHEEATNDRV